MDGTGNLYGTSMYSGSYNLGTVFKVTPKGAETVLHSFQDGSDGALPSGNLLLDQSGNVYGTTQYGGDPNCDVFNPGCGTVFEIKADGTEKILYSFQYGTDGAMPYGGVIADSAGNLYGTTGYGGNYAGECNGYYGCGTIFELTSNGQEKILYAFQGGSDGIRPYAGLVADSAGNFYGATPLGCKYGCVFKLTANYTESVLHQFQCGHDGCSPQHNLTLDSNGRLYGMTEGGGSDHCHHGGCGVVFKVAPNGKETIPHTFWGKKSGRNPVASLLMGSNGLMYGTTISGGKCDTCGVVFSLKE
jgi:uncharacterized repeat protein (TIGR03803 family)